MVKLPDWLLSHAKQTSERREMPKGVAELPEHLEATNDAELLPEPQAGGDSWTLALEPIYTVIDYTDSGGVFTRRRITLLTLKPAASSIHLIAKCHERQAQRSFRCDRIDYFIDEDGVATKPTVYFADVLGIDLAKLSPKGQQEESDVRKALKRLSPALTVLVCAARSDNEFHREELDRILHYVEDELEDLRQSGSLGFELTVELLDALKPAIRRMRPSPQSILWAYPQVLRLPPPRRQRLTRAIEAVIVADGLFRQAEEDFLVDLDDVPAWSI